MIHYVYITINLINGKQYIGDHTINPHERNYYIGSGRPYFKNAVKKYGKENFFKEILEWFETREEAFEAQEKYIKQYNTLIPYGYNVSPKGGYGKNNSQLNENSKNKIRIKKKGQKHSEESKEKISLNSAHFKYWEGKNLSLETKLKIGLKHKGKIVSEETKEKIRISCKKISHVGN